MNILDGPNHRVLSNAINFTNKHKYYLVPPEMSVRLITPVTLIVVNVVLAVVGTSIIATIAVVYIPNLL